jgi:hypothetical protein
LTVVRYDNIRIRRKLLWDERNTQVAPGVVAKGRATRVEEFPVGAKTICLTALTIAAEGGKSEIAKPLQGVGSGVLEIALPFRGDAFRVVYAVQIGHECLPEKGH